MDFVTIAEKFGVSAAFGAALLFILWKLGSRLLNSHDRFLKSMENKGESDSTTLGRVSETLAAMSVKIEHQCKYGSTNGAHQHHDPVDPKSPRSPVQTKLPG